MFSLHAPALTILGIQLLPIFIVFVHLFMPWLMRKSSCHVHVYVVKLQFTVSFVLYFMCCFGNNPLYMDLTPIKIMFCSVYTYMYASKKE
jgi:hypothetical protein